MTFSEYIAMLHNIIDSDANNKDFFIDFFKEITNNATHYISSRSSNTIKSYYNGNRGIKTFFQEIYSEIDSKLLQKYLRDRLSSKEKKIALMKYVEKNKIPLEFNSKNIPKVLADEFFNILTETISPTTDKKTLKRKLNLIKTHWENMYSVGIKISDINTSVYNTFIPTPEIRSLRKEIKIYYDKFLELNEELYIQFSSYPRIESLYNLSLQIKTEQFENRFNIPECHDEYSQILNLLIELFQKTK